MDRSELLQKIKEAFQVYLNDNNALPDYKGLPDMLEAMIAVLDVSPGDKDLSALQEQLQELKAKVDQLEPGVPEAGVEEMIKQAVNAIEKKLGDLRSKDETQDEKIGQLRGDVDQLPSAKEWQNLENLLGQARDRIKDNEDLDEAQQQSIDEIIARLEEVPSKAAVEQLESGLEANSQRDNEQDGQIQQLQQDIADAAAQTEVDALKSNLADNKKRDDRQDGAIDQLRDDLDKVPSEADLEEFRRSVRALNEALKTNNQLDSRQTERIDELALQLDNFATDKEVKALQNDLAQLRAKLGTNEGRDDSQDLEIQNLKQGLGEAAKQTALNQLKEAFSDNKERDDQQDADIQQLQQDILDIPSDAAFEALKKKIEQVQSGLAANGEVDKKQDGQIAQLQQDILEIPTNAAFEALKEKVVALKDRLAQNTKRDDNQKDRIDKLEADLLDKAAVSALKQLEEALNNLESKLSDNLSRDDRQDNDIGQLQQIIAELPTREEIEALQQAIQVLEQRLSQNELKDVEQDNSIKEIEQFLKEVPTLDLIEEIKGAVETLKTETTALQQSDQAQEIRLEDLEKWREEFINRLELLKQQVATKDDLQQVKAALSADLEKLRASLESKIQPLEGLPGRIDELEKRVELIEPGIDAGTAARIAEEKVEALRASVEKRLSAVERKAGQVDGLLTRLEDAEKDIKRLYDLVGEGNGGNNGEGGVSEAYVQKELRNLRQSLQVEISDIDDKYKGLLGLADTVADIQKQVATKTTAEQVRTLIDESINNLASTKDLDQLATQLNKQAEAARQALKASIQKAYQAFVQKQLQTIESKIDELENSMQQELADLLEKELPKIWKQLPDQPFPPAWLEEALAEAGKLDQALKDEILYQAQQWDDAIKAELSNVEQRVEQVIIEQVSKTYATKQALKGLKQQLQDLVQQEVERQIADLPKILTEEEVKAIAASEAGRLDTELSQRIETLEKQTLDARVNTLETFRQDIQNLSLESLKTFITELDLSAVVEKVNALEEWQGNAQNELSKLEEAVHRIQEDLKDGSHDDVASRLSRICLTGWGVIGGLEVFSDKDYCIRVTAGQGICPDGRMVKVVEPSYFSGYYELDKKERTALEAPFLEEIPVWQLVPDEKIRNKNKAGADPQVNNSRWLTPQTNRERDKPFITDKVLLVLPEAKFLLITLKDYLEKAGKAGMVKQLMGRDRPFEYSDYLFTAGFSPEDDRPSNDQLYRAFHPELMLYDIPLHRFGFRPHDDCEPEELEETDFPDSLSTLEELYDTWKPIIDDALNQINDNIGNLVRSYHDILFPQLNKDEFRNSLNILLANWKAYTRHAERNSDSIEKCYVQYFYDWARDLIKAYEEFRTVLQRLMAELCLLSPETLSERNQHLVLGPAWQPHQDGLAPPMRDTFRQPPIYNGNAERWEKARVYYQRLFEMIESFFIEGYLPDKALPQLYRRDEDDPFSPDFSKIKITPSKSLAHPLGEQAIPFYYPLSDGGGSLHYYWDYWRTKSRTYDQHLSYHASNEQDSYNEFDDRPVTYPLYYDLSQYDFYRIEGFIGKSVVTIDGFEFSKRNNSKGEEVTFNIVDAIRYLIRKHNLDIEVEGIHLDTDPDDLSNDLKVREEPTPVTTFISKLLGAEHLGGVPRGGTLFVVLNKDNIAIADFSVPYRLKIEQE
jgi:chromosome segregation ATPase